MPKLATKQQVLTRNELAELLKVNRGWLDHLARRGGGPPYYRIGKTAIRYDKTMVEKWLAGQIEPTKVA